MNLILQAIKSLFRKLEKAVPKNLKDILRIIGDEKIPGYAVEDMYYATLGKYNTVFGEQTLEMLELDANDGRYVNANFATYGVDISEWKSEDHGITEDLFGKQFTVIWDGAEYICEARDNTGYEMFTIGNESIVSANRDDTGEPFCILVDVWWGMEVQLYIRTNEPGAHTVAFGQTVKAGKTVKMHKRYLPEHNHGVTPIDMGGTGGKSSLEVLRNLGLYYTVRTETTRPTPAELVYYIRILNAEFVSPEGAAIVLKHDTGYFSEATYSYVEDRNGMRIPLSYPSIDGKLRKNSIMLVVYDGEKLIPIPTIADLS